MIEDIQSADCLKIQAFKTGDIRQCSFRNIWLQLDNISPGSSGYYPIDIYGLQDSGFEDVRLNTDQNVGVMINNVTNDVASNNTFLNLGVFGAANGNPTFVAIADPLMSYTSSPQNSVTFYDQGYGVADSIFQVMGKYLTMRPVLRGAYPNTGWLGTLSYNGWNGFSFSNGLGIGGADPFYSSNLAIKGNYQNFSSVSAGSYSCVGAADLTIDTSNNLLVTSATHSFVSADVGARLQVTAGTGWTAGNYQITGVSGGAATLKTSPSAAGNSNKGTYTLNRGLRIWVENGSGTADGYESCYMNASGVMGWSAAGSSE